MSIIGVMQLNDRKRKRNNCTDWMEYVDIFKSTIHTDTYRHTHTCMHVSMLFHLKYLSFDRPFFLFKVPNKE